MVYYFFFFFKQKTAYEMRISDWSSDVCSSDLQVEGAAASLDVGPQRLGHVGGRAGGYVPGEALEGQTVDTLHRPGDGLGGRAAVVGNAAPDRHAVLPIDLTPARLGGLGLGLGGGGGEALGGDPDAEPAVAEPTGPVHRRGGTSTDDDGNRGRRGRADRHRGQRDELASAVQRTEEHTSE